MKMKIKIFALLLASTILLSACGGLPSLGIGGNNTVKDLGLQTIQPEPTKAVVSESTYFRDELDKDINKSWGLKVMSGLEKQLIWTQVNGKFRLQTLPPNDVNFVFLNKDHTYKDVIVQAQVENSGQLDNAFSLICRATDAGWYEFRISSGGYYELLRYDAYKKAEGSNPYTNFIGKRVGSSLIKGGLATNVFSISCVGNLITAFVNGEQLYWEKRPLAIEDNTYGDGSIGFGLLGYGKALDVSYDWVEAVKP
jgi:hypothetical protein